MFVEHKEVGEVTEAPAKTLKMSEAIRLGKPLIGEAESDSSYQLCALGCAWAGVRGHKMTSEEMMEIVRSSGNSSDFECEIAQRLGFTRELGLRVNRLISVESLLSRSPENWKPRDSD